MGCVCQFSVAFDQGRNKCTTCPFCSMLKTTGPEPLREVKATLRDAPSDIISSCRRKF